MASTKTRTKTIRLANEAADFYEGVPLNRVAEGVCGLLKDGKLEFDGESVKIVGGGGVYTESKAIGSINEMLGFTEMTFDDLMKDIAGKLESGELMLDEGCTRVQMPAWAERFEEACHDLCIPVEKAAESAIKALKKG